MGDKASDVGDLYIDHVQKVKDAARYPKMVEKLLGIMSKSLDVSGVGSKYNLTNQKRLIEGAVSKDHAAAMARFALGNDDGAYLRSNIMPLQTSTGGDDCRLNHKMTIDMQAASYIGLLNAYQATATEKLGINQKSMSSVWKIGSWMLSVQEVNAFVTAYISKHVTDKCKHASAIVVVENMAQGKRATDMFDEDVVLSVKTVFRALFEVFAARDGVKEQLECTTDALQQVRNGLLEAGTQNGTPANDQLKATIAQNEGGRHLHAFLKVDAIINQLGSGFLPISSNMLSFAMARGLCSRRAVHHLQLKDDLHYYTPTVSCPTISDTAAVLCASEHTNGTVMHEYSPAMGSVGDFCEFENQDKHRIAAWAPAKSSGELDQSEHAISLAAASVMEHLVNYYKKENEQTDGGEGAKLSALAHAAYAKIYQLRHVATVFSLDRTSLGLLCPASDFVTVPVRNVEPSQCGGVQYAFDAGLVVVEKVEEDTAAEEADEADEAASWEYCMFISTPPKTSEFNAIIADRQRINVGTTCAFGTLPKSDEHIAALSPDNLEQMMKTGILLCEGMKPLMEEIKASKEARVKIESELSGNDPTNAILKLGGPRDDLARSRREEVWNDSMREAAISGDRLYAFVRQFSGTIHEQVDSVCVVDESMLVKYQRDAQENTKRLSMLASQQHMQLVSNVFRSVIGESGLTLGIDSKGLDGQFKVVSNTLRKQVSELASGNGGGGFFTNSMRLENLMAQGTGEMTLSGLFERLRDVGVALQQAANNNNTLDGMAPSAPSLDFLSSPRNSLILRYKPESHAAMRQAFDTFSREMDSHHRIAGMYPHRKISAFELIEGRDEELCMAFASFSAHVLAHQRMFSASHAAYLGQFASRANVAAMHFTLNKLIGVACRYIMNTERPRFLGDNGWNQYFRL